MSRGRRRFAVALALLACLAGCADSPERESAALSTRPPRAPREFRAAWVASVANIDWPSRKGLPVAEQKAEIVRIVEVARSLNLNALIVQVRPAADALYPSALEPWSEYLTGAEGLAPNPPYDPLQAWIDECHRRGIAIHAWFNPYRAHHPSASGSHAPSHVSNADPDIVRRYGEYLWMDPGEPAAAARTLAVIVDVVRRYDIDGVHIDDYFYPYPVAVPNTQPPASLPFPDDPAWLRCVLQQPCGAASRDDWRRRNVDTLVEAIHAAVHREKPWVRFGVSPFGIGRPDRRPPGITGFSQYDDLYADVERWLERGWLDYLAPQLYWRRDDRQHAFAVLLEYWLGENPRGRHVWPGLFTTRATTPDDDWPADEIVEQIALVRARGSAPGHAHFSIRALLADRQGVAGRLRERVYREPALVPAAPWLGAATLVAPGIAVTPPRIALERSGAAAQRSVAIEIRSDRDTGGDVRQYAAWLRAGGTWRFAVSPITAGISSAGNNARAAPARISFALRESEVAEKALVFAVDRYGNEGPAARWDALSQP